MTRILDDNIFESLKLFDENSNVNSIVRPKLENIFNRLFNGTEVNSDNFYFTIFEDKYANAFFMNKENTIEKNKHIIAVSRGLIEQCNNEAELAGILGHECGHYLWAELLKGNNTIFQEHAADLRAIDLLINGGYNPRNHLEISKRILGNYGRVNYSDINLGVHGNGLARVDDIKDYMTKIANERGDFPLLDDTVDEDYISFRESVDNAFKNEGYDTYIEKCCKRDFGTKNIDEIDIKDMLNMFLNEINNGNIVPKNSVRFIEMFKIINKYSSKKVFENKSEELTTICQNFFLRMHDLMVNTNFSEISNSDYTKKCSNLVSSMLSDFNLERFGDFAKQFENIGNFINYKDADDAVYWAKEMYKLSWTLDYAHCFVGDKYPHFEPKKEDNIGKLFPWDELIKLNDKLKSTELRWAISSLYQSRYDFNKHYSTQRYDTNEYFLDKDGIVIAYGEEAKKMHKDALLQEKVKSFFYECNSCYAEFKDKIEFFDALAEFNLTDDISKKKELANKIIDSLKTVNQRGLTYFNSRSYYSLHWLKNPHIDEIKERYNSSLMKKHFLSPFDMESRELASRVIEKEKKENLNQFEHLDDSIQKHYDDLYFLETLYYHTSLSANTHLHQSTCMSLLKLCHFVQQYDEEKSSTALENLYSLMSTSFFHKASETDESCKDLYKRLNTDYALNVEDLKSKYYRVALINPIAVRRSIFATYGRETSELDRNVLSEFKVHHLKSSPTLEKAMVTMGFSPEKSFSENMKILDETIGSNISIFVRHDRFLGDIYENIELKNSLYDESGETYRHERLEGNKRNMVSFIEDAGILMLANTIRKGLDYDLKEAMKYLHFSRTSSFYSPIIPDLLALSIQKDDRFSKMPLEDKIYVYEVMEEKKLFSEKYANKIEFFRDIVNDITNEPNKEKATHYAELLLSQKYVGTNLSYNDGRKKDDIEFHKEKDLLIDFYAKSKSDDLGIDDGSDEFYQKTAIIADKLCEKDVDKYDRPINKFPRDTLNAILDKISTNIVSQELTAQLLGDKGKLTFSGKDASQYDKHARVMLAIVAALAKTPENAKTVIDFLSSKCTDESINTIFNKIPETYDLRRGKTISIPDFAIETHLTFDKSTLVMLHENFWHASLPARAYIMKRILNAYTSKQQNDEERKNKKLDLVVDMFFDKNSSYYKDAKKIVHAIYDNLQDYEQDLILGALVSANQKEKDSKQSLGGEAVGEGLKMFFENKGPAFVKFGQMLSYLPQLDPEIRKPLAKLRDKADIPTRAKLFELLKETLPNDELNKISRVDKILGAGSFFVTAKINYEGKDCVVAVMRPFAKELSQSGMSMINNTIECLAKQDSKYETLRNIAYQAKISAESETDIDADYRKYREAIKIYDDIVVTTPDGEFRPNVQKWESYGAGKDGKVFKIMEMAGGDALTSSKISEQQKHDMAVAYTTIELCNLLSGQRWDTDRHQGQQNFMETNSREDGFKKFIIGIFDTGAQIQHDPSKRDKIMLGSMLYGMVRAARQGKNIADYMMGKVKRIDKVGNLLNIDTLYIDEVQRGLTALSDIITYQKEIKDDKGNIVQQEKSLTAKEIGQIATAILESGLVDKHVLKTIKAKAILNKLQPFRKGWISSLDEGLRKISSSIHIKKKTTNSHFSKDVPRKDKPQHEIDDILNNETQTRILGVNVEHIKLADDTQTLSVKDRLAALR